MFALTYSTPDRAHMLDRGYRTHKAILRDHATTSEGAALYHFGVNGWRFIGTLINGELFNPGQWPNQTESRS